MMARDMQELSGIYYTIVDENDHNNWCIRGREGRQKPDTYWIDEGATRIPGKT